jgi:hypothetical protein
LSILKGNFDAPTRAAITRQPMSVMKDMVLIDRRGILRRNVTPHGDAKAQHWNTPNGTIAIHIEEPS